MRDMLQTRRSGGLPLTVPRSAGCRGVATITSPDGDADKLEKIYANLWPGKDLTGLIGHHGKELVSGVGYLRLKPVNPEQGPDGKLIPWAGPKLDLNMSSVCSNGWAGLQELAVQLGVEIQWVYDDDADGKKHFKHFTCLSDDQAETR